jgi:hypothetical protein
MFCERELAPSYDPGLMQRSMLVVWQRLCALPVLVQDAVIYAASLGFAIATVELSQEGDYRDWGRMAAIAYAVALFCCLAVEVYRQHGASAAFVRGTRRVVVALLVIGAVIVPLVAELTWRADAHPGQNAQPEVAVIERAGDRVAANQNPYLAHPLNDGIPPVSDSHAVDEASYFPYLPGMIPFGLLNAAHLPPEFTDARVSLVTFTLLITAIGLAVAGAGFARGARVLQFLVVLPFGALPMVTGGDDLPVLALLFLGLVLADRRRPVLAGLIVGLAGTLKFTAWPLLILLAFAARDREGRPARGRYACAALVALVPSLIAGMALGPAAFFENAVRFPLGLAHVESPAASPLLGEVLTTIFRGDRRMVTAFLALAGLLLVGWYLIRAMPRTPSEAAKATAFILFVATVLAPATRFGYLIYPANLVVWTWFLAGLGTASERDAREVQSRSSRSMRRKTTPLVGAGVAPASAALTVPLTERTSTPTSQS